ncbi:MAG: DivIVA domain-containing protein, partial [Acidipropionibacterium acidipropionici]|nr:DivIVA domain-containing protein [Acidipropionibacterium acidipropionici]
MTGERPRPATPDDVLDAIEALTRSNEQLREQVAQLEAIVRNQPPMRVRRVEPLPVRYPAAPQPGP